ncbi:MAG: hypothetical protein ACFFBP_07985 [Promethearchaeota archaeon]
MADIKLLVNDKEIPMNEFIQEILINVSKGFITSLKGIPEDIRAIKIDIKL